MRGRRARHPGGRRSNARVVRTSSWTEAGIGPISNDDTGTGTHAVGGNHGFGEETVTLVH